METDKYQAIIFDLDGTAVPSQRDGMPSSRLIDAVHRVREFTKIASASGRSLRMCTNIWEALRLEDPCVVSGGSQIVDPRTRAVLWEKHVPEIAIPEIVRLSRGHILDLYINSQVVDHNDLGLAIPTRTNIIVAVGLSEKSGRHLHEAYSAIPGLAVHLLPSWTDKPFDIHITNAESTKRHAVGRLIELLGVSPEQTIGVGDGSNDIPLFEAVGHRVAMGNATDELKSRADFITATVEEDGLAKLIESSFL